MLTQCLIARKCVVVVVFFFFFFFFFFFLVFFFFFFFRICTFLSLRQDCLKSSLKIPSACQMVSNYCQFKTGLYKIYKSSA